MPAAPRADLGVSKEDLATLDRMAHARRPPRLTSWSIHARRSALAVRARALSARSGRRDARQASTSPMRVRPPAIVTPVWRSITLRTRRTCRSEQGVRSRLPHRDSDAARASPRSRARRVSCLCTAEWDFRWSSDGGARHSSTPSVGCTSAQRGRRRGGRARARPAEGWSPMPSRRARGGRGRPPRGIAVRAARSRGWRRPAGHRRLRESGGSGVRRRPRPAAAP